MKLTQRFKHLARQGRAVVKPIGNMPDHLARLTKQSARELGLVPELGDNLAEMARETSQASGLIGSTYPKSDPH